jgi:hypothetical protein
MVSDLSQLLWNGMNGTGGVIDHPGRRDGFVL